MGAVVAVLLACRDADTAAWWQAVGLREDVPAAIAALAAGRMCVELSYADVKHALTWASRVDGWSGAGRPLSVHLPSA